MTHHARQGSAAAGFLRPAFACASALILVTACGTGEKPSEAGAARATASATPASEAAFAAVDTARIAAARETPEEWLTYGGTYDEQRHSGLTQIDRDTIGDLGVAWTYELSTARGVEATPIVVDGAMYVTSAWSVVHALDAATGEELWVYDPEVDRAVGVKACCDVVNRGVAVYDGKIYVGVIDGRLEALDARTGERVWSTVTVDQSKPYTITAAPRVFDGKVIIGNGGAELGVRGYLSAYDAATGDLVWRFYTVPNPEKVADDAASDEILAKVVNDSWGDDGAWVTDGGGGTVWDSAIYDTVNDQVIFGVGNGSPWARVVRDPAGGDNLFLSSIVAVDADTGAYRWHFQTTPGDNWDYTATQSLILAELPLGDDGASRRIVMQAPKNGFFYVLDAATGDLISGDPFVPLNWATGLDDEGRPIEVPGARYGEAPFFTNPGPLGAHNWHPMAFSPDTGLAYIPAQEIPHVYSFDERSLTDPNNWNTGVNFAEGVVADVPEGTLEALRATLKGRLIAWDPVARTPRWSVEHDNAWNGGILSTAGGLVFQGQLSGEFSAYDASTGEELWSYPLKAGAASGPGTYAVDGVQYVAITTGWGSAFALANGFGFETKVPPSLGRVVVFRLGGSASIPDPAYTPIARTPQAELFGTEEMLAQGAELYAKQCGVCHGALGISSGVLPDLRWSAISAEANGWRSVVIDGALASRGMVSFSEVLSPTQAEAIRAYVVKQAHLGVDAAVASTP
ncbi:MAG: PQQ-dependent dehydrogenase, methanol/ethanol family [Pseudomonadales bacterium]|jgi:quinohemoprotein ethanol dehydrogenase|nr:PQQ-dependent dehydrogenase, methanol/ethanol family [Pseudomonadales bacterium]